MSDFAYVLELLEAKGWFLYEDIPYRSFPEIIAAGRTLSVQPGVYYHLVPATAHDSSVEEVRDAVAYARKHNSMPRYNDEVNQGQIDGIRISGDEFVFVSKLNLFTFSLDSPAAIENAIKFNLSNYNIHFFPSIKAIGDYFNKRGIAPQRPSILPSQLRWAYTQSEDEPNQMVIWPENPGDVLFRGQGKRYTPCVSTVCRGIDVKAKFLHELSEANQARLFGNFIRSRWFIELLRETPAMKWLRESRVYVDEMAVAQHYGLPTGYIDLTQSFEVASFFACCRYNSADKSWTPVGEGEGVLYSIEWRTLPSSHFIRPINLQFFPRPSEQWGWTCELRLGEDFDTLPFVRKFIFKHDLAASQHILAKFSHGKNLFPADPLSELADKVISSPVLPEDLAERIAEDVTNDPEGMPGVTVEEIKSLLQEQAGVKLTSDATIPDLARINAELNVVWKQKRDSFFNGIGFRIARIRKKQNGDELTEEDEDT